MRTNPFHRKHSRPLVGILLAALTLRALVPVGFMPMVSADGGFTLALCPGTQVVPAVGDPHAHHRHHPAAEDAGIAQAAAHHLHGGDDGSGSDDAPTGHQQFPCLFAAAAASAPAPDLVALALAVPYELSARAAESADVFFPAILRAQSARAPPSLI